MDNPFLFVSCLSKICRSNIQDTAPANYASDPRSNKKRNERPVANSLCTGKSVKDTSSGQSSSSTNTKDYLRHDPKSLKGLPKPTGNLVKKPKSKSRRRKSRSAFKCIAFQSVFCCGNIFEHECKYRRHLRTKKHRSIFECSACKCIFTSAENLNIHQADAHNRAGHLYFCKICSSSHTSRSNRDRHMETVHSQTRVACADCGRTFKRKDALIRHIKSCHLAKPAGFECAQCNKIFKTKSALLSHISNIHDKGKYQCKECPRTFSSESALEIHSKFHITGYKFRCMMCGRAFKTFSHRERHMRVHSQPVRKRHLPQPGKRKRMRTTKTANTNEHKVETEISKHSGSTGLQTSLIPCADKYSLDPCSGNMEDDYIDAEESDTDNSKLKLDMMRKSEEPYRTAESKTNTRQDKYFSEKSGEKYIDAEETDIQDTKLLVTADTEDTCHERNWSNLGPNDLKYVNSSLEPDYGKEMVVERTQPELSTSFLKCDIIWDVTSSTDDHCQQPDDAKEMEVKRTEPELRTSVIKCGSSPSKCHDTSPKTGYCKELFVGRTQSDISNCVIKEMLVMRTQSELSTNVIKCGRASSYCIDTSHKTGNYEEPLVGRTQRDICSCAINPDVKSNSPYSQCNNFHETESILPSEISPQKSSPSCMHLTDLSFSHLRLEIHDLATLDKTEQTEATLKSVHQLDSCRNVCGMENKLVLSASPLPSIAGRKRSRSGPVRKIQCAPNYQTNYGKVPNSKYESGAREKPNSYSTDLAARNLEISNRVNCPSGKENYEKIMEVNKKRLNALTGLQTVINSSAYGRSGQAQVSTTRCREKSHILATTPKLQSVNFDNSDVLLLTQNCAEGSSENIEYFSESITEHTVVIPMEEW